MEIGLMFIVYVAIAVAAVVLYGAVVAKDLQMLQQNSYRNERYVRWIKTSGEATQCRLGGFSMWYYSCCWHLRCHCRFL